MNGRLAEGDPAVTVVVPYYEAAATVRDTIDSVLAQTWRDFELLVIDDASPTQPFAVEGPMDPRVTVRRRARNGGYAAVTNEAVEAARGEWVVFVDADDRLEPAYLETMLAAGREADADVVFAAIQCVRGGVEIGTQWWDPPGRVTDGRTAMRALIGNDVAGNQHALFRAPRPDAPLGQTYSDWVFVMGQVGRARRVAFVDEPLYLYTIDPGSVSGGLRPSVWDLPRVDDLVQPIIERAFEPREAARLVASQRRHSVTHLLHKAARERADTPLRREATAWCRRRITLRGILALLREGRPAEAASWALAKTVPGVHRRAYQLYDDRKSTH